MQHVTPPGILKRIRDYGKQSVGELADYFGVPSSRHGSHTPYSDLDFYHLDNTENNFSVNESVSFPLFRIPGVDIWSLLEAFENAGLIMVEKNKDKLYCPASTFVEIAPDWLDKQRVLQISLTDLADKVSGSKISVKPIFGAPRPPTHIAELLFLSPFTDEMTRIFTRHIKRVAIENELWPTRADSFRSERSVVSDIWNAICAAKIIVADLTEQNANVFYELGIADVLGTQTILLAQDISKIPFDVQHRRIVEYESTRTGLSKLELKLYSAINDILHPDSNKMSNCI
jgi:hypothetical protein